MMKKLKLQKNIYGGKLFVFEGIDGSGKTTLLNEMKKYLENLDNECVYLKMPSDRVRNMQVFNDYDNSKDDKTRNTINLTNLTIMVSGDRLIQQDEIIIPALKRNKIVLCDRYCFTGHVRCDDDLIFSLCERFIKPDITFVCDCDAKIAKQRVLSRTNEKDNYYNIDDVKNQRRNFLDLARKDNFVVINTNNSIEICKKEIQSKIKQILKK